MDKFDIKSARLVSIVIFICLVFVLVVCNAFKYLPQDSQDLMSINNTDTYSEKHFQEGTDNIQEDEDEDEEADTVGEEESEEISRLEKPKAKFVELENIDTESIQKPEAEIKNTQEDSYSTTLEESERLLKEKQYSKALDSFKRASELTISSSDKADCYEKMAYIYALTQRYGTALSYAQQAFNTSPSSSREVLLARLYYKTGDIEKATKRINNVLQRDFSFDKQ